MLITKGTAADCSHAGKLIAGIHAENLLADRAYDTDLILKLAEDQKMNAIIPPKKNPFKQRIYDKKCYQLRHLVENAFLQLKRWRGIATRYAKNTNSFLASVHIRCIHIWINKM